MSIQVTIPQVTIPQVPSTIPTLPQRQGEFKRLLNAVNGAELRQMIVSRLQERLQNDRRFSQNLTYPLAAVALRLDIIVQPREPENAHQLLELSFGLAEAGQDPQTGEPDFDRISLDAAWPEAVLISKSDFWGLERAPDDHRQEHGLEVPTGRREAGAPAAFEVPSESRDGRKEIMVGQEDISDLSQQAQAKYHQALKHEGPAVARSLLRAMRQRPHKVVPLSPLADPANRLVDAQGQPTRSQSQSQSQEPDPGEILVRRTDPGSAQGRMAVRADARHQQKTPQEIAIERGIFPKPKPTIDPSRALDEAEYDPRAKQPEFARSVTINRDGPNAQKAMEQAETGAPPANREIRIGLDETEVQQGRPEMTQAEWDAHAAEQAQRTMAHEAKLEGASAGEDE